MLGLNDPVLLDIDIEIVCSKLKDELKIYDSSEYPDNGIVFQEIDLWKGCVFILDYL